MPTDNIKTYQLRCSSEGDVLVVLGPNGQLLASGLLSDDKPIVGSFAIELAIDVDALHFAIEDSLAVGPGYTVQASFVGHDGPPSLWPSVPGGSAPGLSLLKSPQISSDDNGHTLHKIQLTLEANRYEPGSTSKRPPIKSVIIETQISWMHLTPPSNHAVGL